MSPATPLVGWLFAYGLDRQALDRPQTTANMPGFDRAGFDLFSFPSNAALVGFDLNVSPHG